MYATLTGRTANRTLAAADLNVPDDGGSCALHAALPPGDGVPLPEGPRLVPIASGGSPLSVLPVTGSAPLGTDRGRLAGPWRVAPTFARRAVPPLRVPPG
jgi:hypothetical protein